MSATLATPVAVSAHDRNVATDLVVPISAHVRVWNRTALAPLYIYPTAETMEENPRREGTAGFLAMELVIAKPGMTVEQYLKLDGTALHHLKWDVSHGFIDIVEAKRPAKKVSKAGAAK